MNSLRKIVSLLVALGLVLAINCKNQEAEKEDQNLLQLLALSGAAASIASSPTAICEIDESGAFANGQRFCVRYFGPKAGAPSSICDGKASLTTCSRNSYSLGLCNITFVDQGNTYRYEHTYINSGYFLSTQRDNCVRQRALTLSGLFPEGVISSSEWKEF